MTYKVLSAGTRRRARELFEASGNVLTRGSASSILSKSFKTVSKRLRKLGDVQSPDYMFERLMLRSDEFAFEAGGRRYKY